MCTARPPFGEGEAEKKGGRKEQRLPTAPHRTDVGRSRNNTVVLHELLCRHGDRAAEPSELLRPPLATRPPCIHTLCIAYREVLSRVLYFFIIYYSFTHVNVYVSRGCVCLMCGM